VSGRLVAVELRHLSLPLVGPFRTSFGTEFDRDVLVVRIVLEFDGAESEGWGECVALREPVYSAEFVDAAELVIAEHLVPRLVRGGPLTAADVADRLAPVKGHPMAKAAVEMAVLDAELRHRGVALARHLAGGVDRTAQRIPSGVSVGMFDTLDELLAAVQGYLDDGYARIKLKIEPGWDLEPVARVRELVGADMGLQVDANTAYGRTDIDHLCRLDDFDLLLIEQPFADDDLLGHARLARASSTPVCLDESIVSVAVAADAIELGAVEVINIKPGRVGGYLEARRIHDLGVERGVPVWCGGMLETGIGRAANAALASLPGFTLPGDISAASRFYARDIVTNPIEVVDGHVAVPTGPGLGFELDRDHLAAVTTRVHPLDLSELSV
jgi:o-succinylbenzoate synthase